MPLSATSMGCGTYQLTGIVGEPEKILADLIKSAWSASVSFGSAPATRKSCFPAIVEGECPPPFVMFTSVEKVRSWTQERGADGFYRFVPKVRNEQETRPGLRFARFIRRNKLGRVVASEEKFNRYHGTNDLKAFIWTPDWEKIRAWGVAKDLLDEQGNLKGQSSATATRHQAGYIPGGIQ